MRTRFACCWVLLLACAGGLAQEGRAPLDVGAVDQESRKAMLAHVRGAGPPLAYVVRKFEKHDVVILGEIHQIRQSCEFVAKVLAPAYHEAGVRCLATEFLRSRHTDRVRRLLRARRFDREAIGEILRDLPWPTWGFEEYRDILEAVWELNRSLPEDAEKLEVLGLDSDWSQYESWFGGKTSGERFRERLAREENMVAVVERRVLSKKRKALVHVGYAHSVTCQGLRLATVLRQRHGQRVFQVAFHHELTPRLGPFLEKLFAEAGGEAKGFDVLGSPLASVTDEESRRLRFLERPILASLAEGYVFLAPVARLDKVTWIPGHINETNFEQARAVALKMKWIRGEQGPTARELDRRMQEVFPGASGKPGEKRAKPEKKQTGG